jgi:predicted enzyme related to lactoylglutathione lyase
VTGGGLAGEQRDHQGQVIALVAAAEHGQDGRMSQRPLLRSVDAITVPVPDLESGLGFYRDALGHPLLWRNDAAGQAGLALPDSGTELVLTTKQGFEPNWLVQSADAAAEAMQRAGGRILSGPLDIPVGRLVVVADPFENVLVLLDLSAGAYRTAGDGTVTGVAPPAADQHRPGT